MWIVAKSGPFWRISSTNNVFCFFSNWFIISPIDLKLKFPIIIWLKSSLNHMLSALKNASKPTIMTLLHIEVGSENFANSMTSWLIKTNVLPSFCFPNVISDNPTATNHLRPFNLHSEKIFWRWHLRFFQVATLKKIWVIENLKKSWVFT